MTCDKCGQPLPKVEHKHVSDGDWTEPFMDINHRQFQTSRCKDETCGRLMVREIKKEKANASLR